MGADGRKRVVERARRGSTRRRSCSPPTRRCSNHAALMRWPSRGRGPPNEHGGAHNQNRSRQTGASRPARLVLPPAARNGRGRGHPPVRRGGEAPAVAARSLGMGFVRQRRRRAAGSCSACRQARRSRARASRYAAPGDARRALRPRRAARPNLASAARGRTFPSRSRDRQFLAARHLLLRIDYRREPSLGDIKYVSGIQ